jgi:hypothetical protein
MRWQRRNCLNFPQAPFPLQFTPESLSRTLDRKHLTALTLLHPKHFARLCLPNQSEKFKMVVVVE